MTACNVSTTLTWPHPDRIKARKQSAQLLAQEYAPEIIATAHSTNDDSHQHNTAHVEALAEALADKLVSSVVAAVASDPALAEDNGTEELAKEVRSHSGSLQSNHQYVASSMP